VDRHPRLPNRDANGNGQLSPKPVIIGGKRREPPYFGQHLWSAMLGVIHAGEVLGRFISM
jgi:hypothetical protein